MTPGIPSCLMFVGDKHGKAEEAINYYLSIFPNSRIDSMERYGADDTGPEGTVKVATFTINGQSFRAMDSSGPHPFTFTPAVSLFVQCESMEEITDVYSKLSDSGVALMPLDNYGFSTKFGWVNDQFGVSWQINLD